MTSKRCVWCLRGLNTLAIYLGEVKNEKKEVGGYFIDSGGDLPGGEGPVSAI